MVEKDRYAHLDMGLLGEAICLTKLLKMGIPCSFAHLQKIDILALHNNFPLRVQVKSTKYRRIRTKYSTYHFSVCSGRLPKVPLTKLDCDIIALVALDIEKVLFYPVEYFEKSMTKRIHPDKFFRDCEKESWEYCLIGTNKRNF